MWVDGRLLAAGAPAVAAEDQGLQLGLAVFDTLLLEHRCLYFLELHLERLERGARELAIAWPPPHDPVLALRSYAEAIGGRDAALRPMLTRGVPGRGPTLVITGRELLRPPEPGVELVVSARRKSALELLEGVKSTNRVRNVLAREEAASRGAYDALLTTHEGDLSEGTISNLWVVGGGRLRTPALGRGCLPGVMRGQLLAELEREPAPFATEEGRVELADLERAEEVFVTNTTGRVIPVTAVIGLVSGLPGSRGPVTALVRQRVERLEAAERDRVARAGGLVG